MRIVIIRKSAILMQANSEATPPQIDLAVIGAGPHALTLTSHILKKRNNLRDKLLAFDPSGEWLTQWRRQFAALEIGHLRSPAVHHPDPNPYELRRFAENRSSELFPPYDLPGSRLFEEFCGDTIKRWELGDRVIKAKVTRIQPKSGRFRLWFEDGKSAIARRVIVAAGSGKPHLPAWANQIQTQHPAERIRHSDQIDLRNLQLQGEEILIVGGGLTSGHLAVGAIARGAKVLLMTRRYFQEKLFDAEPGWLGPKYLKGFAAEPDWHSRWETIQQARNGGSMTPEIMTQLRRLSHSEKLKFHEQCEVVGVRWENNRWTVDCSGGETLFVDRIWLATGTKLDIAAEPMFKEMLERHPLEIVKGLPVLDKHLRWPGCELFLTGGLAALQVGPVARNLSGARMACDRIVPAIVKSSIALSPAIINQQSLVISDINSGCTVRDC
jgi:cation diffusion facilitator CzcD-associated flavoprotein CzcO